jgi:stress response protein SCP2
MSGGDISLSENTKYRNFLRSERRLLLTLLENCNGITEDMLRHKNRWKRLGEKLHPFEFKTKFPKCFEAFDTIRNNKPFETFNSKIEASLITKETGKTATLLKSRPGEYARRLDNLLRLSEDKSEILNTFKEIVENVSSPVLLQILTHFKERNTEKELRIFFPKGNIGKARAINYNLPKLDVSVCQEVISICEIALVEKYKNLKPLENVYLDEGLKNYTIPFALRSASKALTTIARGSKINLPEGDTLRFFVWWKDGKGRTDLDLSAVGLDEKHNYKTEIAYYNLRSIGGYHSGDVTSAPEGASEFIDINMLSFLKQKIRYVVMCVNSFTPQPFCDLPECFAGFMVRKLPNSGEVYEPKTVQNKFDLTANTRVSIPLIIDLFKRNVYWTDIALKNNPSRNNNVYSNMPAITIMAKSMTSLVKPNLYDLFNLHIRARGNLVTDIQYANTIFAVEKGIKPTDTARIISEFL